MKFNDGSVDKILDGETTIQEGATFRFVQEEAYASLADSLKVAIPTKKDRRPKLRHSIYLHQLNIANNTGKLQ
jgi:hypothetical protein